MNLCPALPPPHHSSDPTLGLLQALSAAQPQPTNLLQAALGPLCAEANVRMGMLMVMDEENVVAAAVCEGQNAVAADTALIERLLTQGIAGYAAARETPLLLRDIAADPRWAPPSLDHTLPNWGAALAVPVGSPARAVLVLVASEHDTFSAQAVAWLEHGMQLLCTFLDTAFEIAMLRQSLSRMQARELLRRDLTEMAMHDMATPLQNIRLAFSAAARLFSPALDAVESARADDVFQQGQNSAAHLACLSSTLLDIARLEQDSMLPMRQVTAIETVIASALDATAVMVETSGCTLTVELAPDLPELMLDTDLIQRVLMNLIENALKYTPPGAHIHISAARSAHGVAVRVADSGPGIPPEFQEEIFNKHFHMRSADCTLPRGAGLGLAFCRLAVNAHGGIIWVENNPEGGSVFVFTLPASA